MDKINTDSIVIEEPSPQEDEEKVRIYGSTGATSPSHAKSRPSDNFQSEDGDDRKQGIKATSLLLPSPSGSRKSVAHSDDTHVTIKSLSDTNSSWRQHPKIRENWRVVVGAFLLTVVGLVMLLVGLGIIISPNRGMHCLVFFVGGSLCIIPGAYHLVYIYLAVRGVEGYSLYNLPVFN